jgi:hypothetical protein
MSFHLNNSRFSDYVDHIYAPEFEIKHTTDTARYTNVVGILLHINEQFITGKL